MILSLSLSLFFPFLLLRKLQFLPIAHSKSKQCLPFKGPLLWGPDDPSSHISPSLLLPCMLLPSQARPRPFTSLCFAASRLFFPLSHLWGNTLLHLLNVHIHVRVIRSLSWGLPKPSYPFCSPFLSHLLAKPNFHTTPIKHTHTYALLWSSHGMYHFQDCCFCVQVVTCISISNAGDKQGQKSTLFSTSQGLHMPTWLRVCRDTFLYSTQRHGLACRYKQQLSSSHACSLGSLSWAQVCQGSWLPVNPLHVWNNAFFTHKLVHRFWLKGCSLVFKNN